MRRAATPPAARTFGVTVQYPPTPHGNSGVRSDCHAHSAPAGLHHVGRGHWVRNLVDTVVGAVRAVVR